MTFKIKNMKDYKKQFKGKKITIMGLGLLGRGLGYTKFLVECGADLIVTDLKSKEQLATSIKALSKYSNPEGKSTSNGAGIKFVLGKHRLEDFRNRDMIIKSAGVPLDSIYINEARKNGIPIEMDVSLFAKCMPNVMIVGVTGTRGKSMTTMLIYEILSAFFKNSARRGKKSPSTTLRTKKPTVFLGGNIRGVATLPFLKKAKDGDILVCELDSWQLQGFGEDRISPHISVFTTFMPDHMNYYTSTTLSTGGSTKLTTGNAMKKYFADKANIFKFQKKDDVLIIRPDMKKYSPLSLRTSPHSPPYQGGEELKSKLIIANPKNVSNWQSNILGAHNLENLACAVAAAQVLGVPKEVIKKAVKNFKGVEGRLQYMKTVKGVKIYNDNNATIPEATVAGLEALKSGSRTSRNIVLICGGADKGLDLKSFVNAVNKYCKSVVFLSGTGTEKLKVESKKLKVKFQEVKNLKDAVVQAMKFAKKGDIILFSPAFASFGLFTNEYDRNDQFMKIIKKLK